MRGGGVLQVRLPDLLAGMQLRTRLDEAPGVGQQLLDDPAEPVQLGAGRHGQLFDQFDAHARILPMAAGTAFRLPTAYHPSWLRRPTSRQPPRAATRRCGCPGEFSTRVWGNQAMSDEGLAMCINRLRRALRPHGWAITAEYGIGYRLRRDARQPTATTGSDASYGYAHPRQLLEQKARLRSASHSGFCAISSPTTRPTVPPALRWRMLWSSRSAGPGSDGRRLR